MASANKLARLYPWAPYSTDIVFTINTIIEAIDGGSSGLTTLVGVTSTGGVFTGGTYQNLSTVGAGNAGYIIDTSNGFRFLASGGATNLQIDLNGNLTANGSNSFASMTLSAAVSTIVPGATSLSLRNHANSADNLIITDAGAATIRNGLTITAGGAIISTGGLTITNGNLVFSANSSRIQPGGVDFAITNAAFNANNLLITDAGLATIRAGLTVTAGTTTVGTTVIQKDLQRSRQSIAYAATITPDATAGEIITVGALTAGITVAAPTNPVAGQQLTFIFVQDATGSRTVTWNAVFKVGTFVISSAANSTSTATFTYNGSNWLLVNSTTGL